MRVVAYLDAGTGSMLVGAVAAAGASVAVFAKAGLRRATGGFGSKKRGKVDTPADVPAPTPAKVADDDA